MGVPPDRKYLTTHEWHKVEGDLCVIGITQFAADELTDITYVGLPSAGQEVSAGATFGEIESVKATSDLVSGVSGVVAEVNEKLGDAPELLNNDSFNEGWIVKIRMSDAGQIEKLLSAADYDAQVGG